MKKKALTLLLIAAGLVSLVAFILLVLTRPLSLHEEPASAPAFESIDRYVREQMGASRITGAALAIVEGDQIVHLEGYGSDGRGDFIAPDTPFWIGSLTKSFTALAVMQLVEAGSVDLDAPVQEYLAGFRVADEEASRALTPRHLLHHTSGFSRVDGLEPLVTEREQTLEEAVADLQDVRLNRPVGESLEYSNLNYVVLGRIVEVVAGQPWAEYVQENILEPLGMDRTFTTFAAAEEAGATDLFQYWFGYPVAQDPPYLEGLAPTGYLSASVENMARYVSMYLQGGSFEGTQILSEDGIREMLTPATNTTGTPLLSTSFERSYGMGWFIGPFGAAEDARWHLGAMPFLNAWMVLLPETDQAVVLLINSGSQLEFAGANEVMARLPIGVVNLLQGQEPPTGISLMRFYLVFNLLVLAILAAQVWSLVRVARGDLSPPSAWGEAFRSTHGARSGLRAAGPLVWELGIAAALLITYPAILGFGWRGAFLFAPDLSTSVAAIALLWILTGLVRIARLVTAPRRRDGRPAPSHETGVEQTLQGGR